MLVRWVIANYYRQAAQKLLEEAIGTATRMWTGEKTAPVPPEHFQYAIVVGVRLEASEILRRTQPTAMARYGESVEHWGYWNQLPLRVIETGMGEARALAATREALTRRRPQWVCAVGFAAALREELSPGSLVFPERVVDKAGRALDWQPATWPFPNEQPKPQGVLVSLDHVLLTGAERRQAAEQYGAVIADQEAAGIVRACQAASVPCSVVRVVTDAWDERLPEEVRRWLRQKSWAGKLGAITGSLLYRREKLSELWSWRKRAQDAAEHLARLFEHAAGTKETDGTRTDAEGDRPQSC
jgi:nucleoside phosphorylase